MAYKITVTTPGNVTFSSDAGGLGISNIKWGTPTIVKNADHRNGSLSLTLMGDAATFAPAGLTFEESYIAFLNGATTLFEGIIRSATQRDIYGTQVEIDIVAQDFVSALQSIVVDPSIASGVRHYYRPLTTNLSESDYTRIQWLFDTFAPDPIAGVTLDASNAQSTYAAPMPDQDFTGMTLAEAMDDICRLTGATWGMDGSDLIYGVTLPSGVELVTNAGFEDSFTGWTTTASNPVNSSSTAHTGSHSCRFDAVAAYKYARQTLAAFADGDVVSVSYWWRAVAGNSTNGAGALITGVTPTVVGANKDLQTSYGGEWSHRTFSFTCNGAAASPVLELTNSFGSGTSTGQFWIDDVSVTVVHAPAPYGLSDAPDNVTTFGYHNLSLPSDTSGMRNRVVVIGGNSLYDVYDDADSQALYGVRVGVVKDSNLTDATALDAAGAAYLSANAIPDQNGSLVTYAAGFEPGQDVHLTNANAGGTQTVHIATVTTNYPGSATSTPVSYALQFGPQAPATLKSTIKEIAFSVASEFTTKAMGANARTGVDLNSVLTVNGLLRAGSSNFPEHPTTDDQYYRSDRNVEFFYDGTRWLSNQLFQSPLLYVTGLTGEAATDSTSRILAAAPTSVGSDIYLVDQVTQFLINGGTALSASHKWVMTFSKRPTGNTDTTFSTVTIDSGSSSVWRTSTVSVNALMNNGTTHYVLARSALTKTGTPGSIFWTAYVTYRMVAT